MQKLVRAGFGNNNVDTCARVCHSPTGYGLKNTLGESAGTQNFDSVMKADVIFVIGANPTDGHPVFASQMKRRLRQGAKLIVADPRRIDLVRTPHIKARLSPEAAARHQRRADQFAGARRRHRRPGRGRLRRASAARSTRSRSGATFVAEERNSPEAMESVTGVPAADVRAAARLYATGGNGAIYYGLGVTEHSQGSTMVMGIANLAMATGNIGREGVGVNPLRGQNNVQGSCDMGSFPHEFPRLPARLGRRRARSCSRRPGASTLQSEPGLRIPNMFEAALDGEFKALYIEGEDIAQSDPNTQHVTAALTAMECIVVQDLFLNEIGEVRARVPAGLVVPREGRHVHQCRAPHLARAQGHGAARTATRTGRSRSCCRTRSAIR